MGRRRYAVIGCAVGHGRAVAEQLAQLGTELVLYDKLPEVQQLASTLSQPDFRAEGHVIDVEDIVNLLSTLKRTLPTDGIDAIVYFPRAREPKDGLQATSAQWDRDLNIGLKGAHFAVQAATPFLELRRSRNPSVIFVSSVLSEMVGVESVGYHSAKAGLEQLTRFLAVKLGPLGIRANALQIGIALKGNYQKSHPILEEPEFQRSVVALHPLGEVGTSEDITHAIRFLGSTGSRFITGQVICVDGGLTIQEPVHLLRSTLERLSRA